MVLKMIQGESPCIIFDIIMTRFEEDYNPTIIYDASCRIKEYGLNREPGRFTKIRFAPDPHTVRTTQPAARLSSQTCILT